MVLNVFGAFTSEEERRKQVSQEETVTTDRPRAPRQLSRRAKTARFVVCVDHQAKSSFDSREDAENEVQRIIGAFPKLSASVTDVQADDGESSARNG
jgi:hypothetical protein